jgi:adenylate cyclase
VSNERVERRLAAILAADVAGYSRLMGVDEEGTLAALKAHRTALIDPKIEEHHGRIVKTMGDGMLVEYASVVDALRCAIEVANGMAERNTGVPRDRRIEFRVGINIGDIIFDEGDIHGDGVNIAARLEALAEPGGICISSGAHDQVRDKLDIIFEDMGEQQLKNIARPVRAYAILLSAGASTAPAQPVSSSKGAPELPLPDRPSLAVMPFQNMSGDPAQDYFGDGIAEDLISNLSRQRWLFVIARSSTFTFKGQSVNVRQVGEKLGVRYVLEGSVRRFANRVRITAQLTEAQSGIHVWGERYDRPLEDVFAVQDEITDTLARTLEPEIGAAERERARRKPPDSLDAWERYQRGMWHLLRRNREDFTSARALFLEAIAIDPNFATVHAAFAFSCFFQITHGYVSQPDAMRDQLVASAAEAIALDPRDPLGHSAMGMAFMECRQLEKGIAEHKIALELNPNGAFAHWAYGYTLLRAQQPGEAIEQFDIALRLSPRDPATWTYLTLKAASLYQLKKYDEAVIVARDATRFPVADLIWPYVWWVAALGQLRCHKEAQVILRELLHKWPGLTVAGFRDWPHNRSAPSVFLDHTVEGLSKAGLPE